MTAIHRPRLTLTDYEPRLDSLRDEVLAGLAAHPQKRLPCKFFYDERGSRLFDQICELPEYYPTRTELGIMRRHAAEMASTVGGEALLVELGSGSSVKTRLLLDHLVEPAGYVPVDISREHLLRSARSLAAAYPRVEVLPVCADYMQDFALPTPAAEPARRAIYFPGSTIGNLTRVEARHFLARMSHTADGLLIGVDLRKPRGILLPAYDDAQGVTAAFNGNLLLRINRELGAAFSLARFAHRAIWNEAESRIEMHLEALDDHAVHVAGRRFHFRRGETIHTENSHKWSLGTFAELAAGAGWRLKQVWTDPKAWFSVQWHERA